MPPQAHVMRLPVIASVITQHVVKDSSAVIGVDVLFLACSQSQSAKILVELCIMVVTYFHWVMDATTGKN